MKKKHYAGRKLVFWGAVCLFLLSGYELYIRFDTVSWAIRGLINLCVHESIPFYRAISYFDGDMFVLLGELLAFMLLGIVAFSLRNRPRSGYFLILMSLLLAAYSSTNFVLPGLNWTMWLKYIPALLICTGSIINIIHFHRALRHERQHYGRHAHKDDSVAA